MHVNIDLEQDDARFLYDQLVRHVETMQIELAHTEHHELQHRLARDLARMQRITSELDGVLRKAQ